MDHGRHHRASSDEIAFSEAVGALRLANKLKRESAQNTQARILHLGQMFRVIRTTYAISLPDVAAMTGINKGNISQFETLADATGDDTRDFSPDYALNLCRSLMELVWDRRNSPNQTDTP